MIVENCQNRNTDLSTAWIDAIKVFDSAPYSWIGKCLETFKIPLVLRNFFSHSIRMWKTILVLNTEENAVNAGYIIVKNGDFLCPILLYVDLICFSKLVNYALNHLLYMDNLKLFRKNDRQLQDLWNIVKQHSDDIQMDVGLDKRAKATFLSAKLLKARTLL